MSIINTFKKNASGFFYIGTGLFKTFIQIIASFIILRWIEPKDLGQWQSFTVFTGYLSILTLGTTSGLNRELPFYLGKGEEKYAMELLKSALAFTNSLSFFLTVLISIGCIIAYLVGWLDLNLALMCFVAFSLTAINIQTNLLGATFRSNSSFKKLGDIQMLVALFHLLFLPIVYYFNIWGYIIYQFLMILCLFLGYWYFRPYKIKSSFKRENFITLVKIGMPMYIWNYISQMSRTIPRIILIFFGTPYLVGIYSPAESINKGVLNLPNYINRYLFPKMSYAYGKSNEKNIIIKNTFKTSTMLFIIMFFIATILALLMPYLFEIAFPKYINATHCVQIVLYSGVFYSVNSLMHNTMNSLKIYKYFKLILVYKIISLLISTFLMYYFTKNLLISVAIGATFAECINLLNFSYFLIKIKKS